MGRPKKPQQSELQNNTSYQSFEHWILHDECQKIVAILAEEGRLNFKEVGGKEAHEFKEKYKEKKKYKNYKILRGRIRKGLNQIKKKIFKKYQYDEKTKYMLLCNNQFIPTLKKFEDNLQNLNYLSDIIDVNFWNSFYSIVTSTLQINQILQQQEVHKHLIIWGLMKSFINKSNEIIYPLQTVQPNEVKKEEIETEFIEHQSKYNQLLEKDNNVILKNQQSQIKDEIKRLQKKIKMIV